VAAAATIAYLPVFSNSFAWDDEYLVLKNPAIQKLSSIPGFFAESWAGGVDYELGKAQNKPYFRPMALTSMTLDWAVAGPDRVVFHTTNLIIHIVAAWFLFLWLLKVFQSARYDGRSAWNEAGVDAGNSPVTGVRRISAPLLAAFLGALVWAVHPVSTEAVNLVSYRTSLISGLTIFAGLFLLTPGPQPADADHPKTGVAAICIATLLYAAGLLSKETTLVMPGLLFVIDMAFRRFTMKRFAAVYLPLGVVALAWVAARSQFTGAGVYTYFEGLTVGQSILMFGRIFYLYIRLAFVPWPLCPFYDWGIMGVPKSILEPDIAAGFILAAGIVTATILTWRRSRMLSAGLAFFLMALLPVSHIIPFFDAAGDRFMYVPLAGIVLAFGGAFMDRPVDRKWKRPGFAALAVVIAGFMVLTFVRSDQWKSSESMLRVTTRDFPTSISAHLGLGRLLLEKGHPVDAQAPLKQVMDLAPNLAIGHALMAVAQARSGDIHGARMTLRRSPMAGSGEMSAVQLARNEFLKAKQQDLALRIGLMSPYAYEPGPLTRRLTRPLRRRNPHNHRRPSPC
jgi:hypothetical protein